MNALVSLALAAATYLIVTAVLFGGLLSPIALLTIWSDRLGAPYWQLGVIVGIAFTSAIFVPPIKGLIAPIFMPPVLVAGSLVMSTILVGVYAGFERQKVVRAFAPDHILQQSFFRSIREAPRDVQFFLHAAALKNCVPYAWSYSRMNFYILPPNVAANVMPPEWIAMCSIERKRR